MRKKNNEININKLFNYISKNKIIIIIITLCFISFEIYNNNRDKSDNIYDLGAAALINNQPKSQILNLVNSNRVFFDFSTDQNIETIIKLESEIFKDAFFSNFISNDNFLNFLKEMGSQDLYEKMIYEKNNSKNVYINKLGISNQNSINTDLKELSKIEVPKGTALTYFIYKSNIDGRKILDDYLNYVSRQSVDLYLKQKVKEFDLILKEHISAFKIAEKLNIVNPITNLPSTELIIRMKTKSTLNIGGSVLYLRGTDILKIEIEDMQEAIKNLQQSTFSFNLIIDSPFIFYSNKTHNKTYLSKIVKSLFSGLFLSFIVLFLKSIFLDKRKIIKKKV